MLYEPDAHEPLAGEPWSPDRARSAIATIVADTENDFDDRWPTHPEDAEDANDLATRFRTVYLGGAGVVAALHRLASRGFVELRRDYVATSSLERMEAGAIYERERRARVGVGEAAGSEH